MKILVFSQYYYPERFLINDITRKMAADGDEITVVTGLPNYPEGSVPAEYRKGRRRDEIIDGVRVIRCPIVGRGKNKIKLLVNYFSYMFSAARAAKKLPADFDAVLVYQLTPVLQIYPAIRYCEKNNKKPVCYCCDLAPASGLGVISKFGLLKKWYADLSKWLYQRCDIIAVTSKSFIGYMQRQNGIDGDKLRYIPQHAPDFLLDRDCAKQPDGVSEFMFAGNLGEGAALETILYAAQKLKKQGLSFAVHFVGRGRMYERLLSCTRSLQLEENVVFHEPVPMEKMPELYKLADALLVTLRKGQITVPSKVQSYMAVGKPIFGAVDGSAGELIAEAGCGACAAAEDADGLAELMADYCRRPEYYEKCGENGRRFFKENFTIDTYVKRLKTVMHEACAKPKGDTE